ncbi:hypothetical protein [Pelagicoccus sp. SDUM812003]|uniref:hypothetical protein n=1 Tax=Pelagicoccus sp. SDUM812003 TaxID=3041267 RepID=UPI00280E10AE|nr:hypothetical protein [Pelagicoccus sp. SDUM812003]MDQ8201487.1 hypothetical protein [Pelagicoccus sp. SDUM812003]
MRHEDENSELVEAQLPPLSGIAFHGAREQVLNSGNSVVEMENGDLFRIEPNRKKVFLKSIGSPYKVKKGEVRRIK